MQYIRGIQEKIKKFLSNFRIAEPHKTIYIGIESSGKSLSLARDIKRIIIRNSKYNKITGRSRAIVSNLRFTKEVEQWAKHVGVEIKYWRDLEELTYLNDCDIIIDEIGNYFDSRRWAELSIDVRKWVSQSAKAGIEMYGTSQRFGQIELSFRGLVDNLQKVTKVIGSPRPTPTRPPVTMIFGICTVRRVNPLSFKDDSPMGEAEGFPSFFFIAEEDTKLYDTRQIIEVTDLPAYRHQVRKCSTCDFVKIIHN